MVEQKQNVLPTKLEEAMLLPEPQTTQAGAVVVLAVRDLNILPAEASAQEK